MSGILGELARRGDYLGERVERLRQIGFHGRRRNDDDLVVVLLQPRALLLPCLRRGSLLVRHQLDLHLQIRARLQLQSLARRADAQADQL